MIEIRGLAKSYGDHQALQDVSHEHARKTVTVDGHPHTGVPAVSIHPCRHGAVMKKIADQMAEGEHSAAD